MTSDTSRDDELRRRLRILHARLEAGTIKFAPEPFENIRKSLLAVRLGSDGEIDLNTADSIVRSMAQTVGWLHDRQEAKENIPLRRLQEAYFDHIEQVFGHYHRKMIELGLSPNQVAMGVSRHPEEVDELSRILPEFCDWISDFWKETYDVANWHIEDRQGLHAVFGGDLFPAGKENLASVCGVYVDTLVLPDPFLRTTPFLGIPPDNRRVHYFVKHALGLLNYRDFALADVSPPIVVVVPDRIFYDDSYAEFVGKLAAHDNVRHLSRVFGQDFHGEEDLSQFLRRFDNAESILSAARDVSRVLFNSEDKRPIIDQFSENLTELLEPMGFKHPGDAIALMSVGRMRQVNDLIERSRMLGSCPMIDAPTSWQYFKWKLEYDAERLGGDRLGELHMVRGLQSAAAGEMTWLGRVPAAALIEMRRQDVLPELRSILSDGMTSLVAAKPKNFFRTGDQVVDNIQRAFDEHSRRLRALRGRKWRFAGVELAGCIAHGAVEIAAACGVPFVSLIISVIDQAGDVPKLRELPARYRQLGSEQRDLDRSPVGLLFRCKKKGPRGHR